MILMVYPILLLFNLRINDLVNVSNKLNRVLVDDDTNNLYSDSLRMLRLLQIAFLEQFANLILSHSILSLLL